MQLEECYAFLGGNYQDMRKRLGSDKLIEHFLVKFLSDKSYEILSESLEGGNYEEAFKAAHTLKGVCQNLSFDRLANSSAALTELLRSCSEVSVNKEQCAELFEQVSNDYRNVITGIQSLHS